MYIYGKLVQKCAHMPSERENGIHKMVTEIRKSIISGLLISIGGSVYICCSLAGIGWLGAILFTFGLYTICEYGFSLFTGKVGYIAYDFRDVKYIGTVAVVLLFNLLATFAVGALMSLAFEDMAAKAAEMYSAKLGHSLFRSFLSSVLCGLIMFIAVDTNKRVSKLGMFLGIPTFIFCGFDHSIANSFYNGLALGADTFTLNNAAFIVVVILGNAVGGMLLPLLMGKKLRGEK